MAGIPPGGDTMKRCIIELPKIRISKPGFDVDTAAFDDFLFHEDFLFAQPYFAGFVACPFAGYTGKAARQETVSVTVPDVTADPIVLLFLSGTVDENIFPAIRSKGSGNDSAGYNTQQWWASHSVISSTQIDVVFVKGDNFLSSPNGAFMIAIRKPI